ncbi:NAD(P)-dependent alcohol dehydrogenase [Actinoplanes sp. NBRC 103695]|uniref:NAD(P)-dependent alcohol dehydrogenase n=1 Tax=Actinoplanes sp. NBRC 103695 TaxID=3032202 RepID=UPI0024A330A3|nr:NAD(P)-dependent alcohol dehydrogenase [Actinoplanes sp. NBRC 103695]GLZ01823.1 NADP-dependent alcohol dehydrogenase [Actinoplanes sp. NBRC 103695]
MRDTIGWAALDRDAPLRPWAFQRRDLREDDVAVRVEYCGVCSSDISAIRHRGDDPLVPGHEMTGEITAVGAAVTGFRIGDKVAVGNIIDSCGECGPCLAGRENWCARFPTLTYGNVDPKDGMPTRGGYSSEYVLPAKFTYHLPAGLDPAAVAPLMCAGVTTYVPLKRWGAGPGKRVGIVGMGGLGHLALKIAHHLGAEVVQFTRTLDKAAEARALGADDVVLSTDEQQMAAQRGRFDLILDTAGAPHSIEPYVAALAMDGTLCVVGIPEGDLSVNPLSLIQGAKTLAGAGSGGTRETQEMLDFCAGHRITADIEILPQRRVNEALDRLARNDVRYRFVLDMTTAVAGV